ncbi:zinc ion binding protein [Actinidia rufa]|uniref:Zinc ion binding protein n=1 Tax=Actinidia rufa TaxID=165716 RepID=A0A7J0GQ45_9ERIC|nr:zinc ion binding protein [Actinidia rufa]
MEAGRQELVKGGSLDMILELGILMILISLHCIATVVGSGGADTFYTHAKWTRPRILSKLKGLVVNAVAWNRQQITEASTREVILGTDNGQLHEIVVDEKDKKKEKHINLLYELKELPEEFTSLQMETATSGNRTRYYVMAVTPTRLYSFTGIGTLEGHQCVNIDVDFASSDVGSISELHFFIKQRRAVHFAWLSGAGIYHGGLYFGAQPSSTDGDENFVENKGLLDYSKLTEGAEAVKPSSMAVSEFHFLLLIGNKVKVVNRISEQIIEELQFDQTTESMSRGIIGLCSDASAGLFYAYDQNSIFQVSVNDEGRDMWKVHLDLKEYAAALANCRDPLQRDQVYLAQLKLRFLPRISSEQHLSMQREAFRWEGRWEGRIDLIFLLLHLLALCDSLLFSVPFFGGAEAQQLGYLQYALLCFEAISRTEVNLKTSALLPVEDVEIRKNVMSFKEQILRLQGMGNTLQFWQTRVVKACVEGFQNLCRILVNPEGRFGASMFQVVVDYTSVWSGSMNGGVFVSEAARSVGGRIPLARELVLRDPCQGCPPSSSKKAWGQHAVFDAVLIEREINHILSFEEITLKFIGINETDALRTFLLRKLDNLAKDDKCQITMISTWATELYLDKINRLLLEDDTASENRSPEYHSIIKEFRAFLSDCKDVLDEATTMKLLESYGRVDELVYFASLKKQYEIVVHHYIQQGEAKKALEVLQKPDVPIDLQYKFAPDLIMLDAYETVESWMTTKNLNPRKLIPAMMRYSSEPHASLKPVAYTLILLVMALTAINHHAVGFLFHCFFL